MSVNIFDRFLAKTIFIPQGSRTKVWPAPTPPAGGDQEVDTAGDVTSSAKRNCFFAEGLFWVFYWGYPNVRYRTSADGITWSAEITVKVYASAFAARDFSVWFDDVYLHYVIGSNAVFVYRKGKPNADGTITWSAAEQNIGTTGIPPGGLWQEPIIITNSSGYPFVSCNYLNAGSYGEYVFKSSTKDGTWVNDTGFPYLLDNRSAALGLYPLNLVPLNGDKVFFFGFIWDHIFPVNLPRGRLWNGSSWGAWEDFSGYVLTQTCSVGIGDEVHFTCTAPIQYGIRYSDGTLSVPLTIGDVSHRNGTLSKHGSDLYVFSYNIGAMFDWYDYKRKIGGVWDPAWTNWFNSTEVANGWEPYANRSFYKASPLTTPQVIGFSHDASLFGTSHLYFYFIQV